MRALVTGGAGFIGSYVADDLIDKGHEVLIIDDLSGGKRENVNPKATFIQKDLNNLNSRDDLLKDIDIIYHYVLDGHFIIEVVHVSDVQ